MTHIFNTSPSTHEARTLIIVVTGMNVSGVSDITSKLSGREYKRVLNKDCASDVQHTGKSAGYKVDAKVLEIRGPPLSIDRADYIHATRVAHGQIVVLSLELLSSQSEANGKIARDEKIFVRSVLRNFTRRSKPLLVCCK